jgi:hypothetical protein
MKGPIKRQIAGLGWLELGLTLAGLTVVSGLLVESGPELWDALVSQSWPARGVTGGVVVTIGVLAEVIIGVLIAQEARRKEREANLEIAASNDRASKAEQAAAEANLASRKLEVMLVDRKLSNPIGFIEAMRAFSGTSVMFIVADDMESMRLCSRLENDLRSAGWTIYPMPQRVSGLSECVVLALQFDEWYTHGPLRNATVALGDWLNEDGVVTAPEFQSIKTFTGVTIKVGSRPSTLTAFEALRKGWRWTLDQLIVR